MFFLVQFLCTVVAILLHYFFMSAFAWLFVEALHIYRMQTEVRNINYGAMRFYYAIGWGVPAIITGMCTQTHKYKWFSCRHVYDVCVCFAGLAVGLDPEGYGNPDFCWISMYDKLMWSFAGPVSVVILVLHLCVFVCVCAWVTYKYETVQYSNVGAS